LCEVHGHEGTPSEAQHVRPTACACA
jgi:hypothetical protein